MHSLHPTADRLENTRSIARNFVTTSTASTTSGLRLRRRRSTWTPCRPRGHTLDKPGHHGLNTRNASQPAAPPFATSRGGLHQPAEGPPTFAAIIPSSHAPPPHLRRRARSASLPSISRRSST